MDQQTLNLFFGVGALAAVIGLIIAMLLMHRQVSAITAVLQSVNSNPALDAAIAGATAGVPQVVFVQLLAVLSAIRTLDPNTDQQALLDQLAQLIKSIEPKTPADKQPVAPSVALTVPSGAVG